MAHNSQEALQRSEKLYRHLVESQTDVIVRTDLPGRLTFANLAACQTFGLQLDELRDHLLFEFFHPDDLPQARENMTALASPPHRLTVSEQRALTVNGIRWFQWNVTAITDELGQVIETQGVGRDITEKKQLEAQLLRLQRLESLGTLASGIAHDLNNILAPIMFSVQMLTLKLPYIDARNQQLLKIIENNSKRAADLVKQILTFARGSEGRSICLQIEPLLLEVEQILNSTFPKSIIISKNLSTQNLWRIKADPSQIHQVLMNLCVNARDAMPEGGTLSICANNFFVDENFARMNLDANVGDYVVITVSDTGFGMAPLILDRIFEPFFTTKEPGKGTGLGLSTVIGIVKNYRGFINVESEVSKGTQFQVYLPADEERTNQQAENLELSNGNRELILVVDDEAAILEITKTSLEDYNYRTLTASNAIEAVSLYAEYKNQISIVLMDMMMPSMDGLTAIRILQKMNPQVKIIAISGSAANSPLIEAADAGINLFLQKPYTLSQLLYAIKDLLS
ncbi:response regulator [Komarekiella sp. 'clone 1']|uniref:histidine kinase n=1 Tax=Komarekiella delphini-convector SJRDD-AB1 TaxID=2593771 RepID=A0AA40T2X1_9NOST|nr:response regulator [Komarekiella delphini-convector]MBD6619723.1 response regulator [Komarekiella delphini-convector SJRDD-AB1]